MTRVDVARANGALWWCSILRSGQVSSSTRAASSLVGRRAPLASPARPRPAADSRARRVAPELRARLHLPSTPPLSCSPLAGCPVAAD
eukprot:13850296-Alexandrium_andersonii.AAC.1